MFVNHTNHLSDKWSAEQRTAAVEYGKIVDFPFPNIGADWDEKQVADLIEVNTKKIIAMNPAAVLCQGEYSYTYAMINYCEKNNIPVLAAASARIVEEIVADDGTTQKILLFKFIRFRQFQ